MARKREPRKDYEVVGRFPEDADPAHWTVQLRKWPDQIMVAYDWGGTREEIVFFRPCHVQLLPPPACDQVGHRFDTLSDYCVTRVRKFVQDERVLAQRAGYFAPEWCETYVAKTALGVLMVTAQGVTGLKV